MVLATIYTSSSVMVGAPTFPGLGVRRLSDVLNNLDSDFIELTSASIQALTDTDVAGAAQAKVMVRRRDALLVVPQGEPRRESLPLGTVLPRNVVPVILSITPFRIAGMVHMAPDVDFAEHLRNYRQRFMAITDATVTLQVNPAKNFEAPFLLVNRELIDVAGALWSDEKPALEVPPTALGPENWITQEWMGKAVDTAPPIDTAPQVEQAQRRGPMPTRRGDVISGEEAAQVLAKSPLFGGTDLERLERICQDLADRSLLFPHMPIRRLPLAAGDELFSAGSEAEGLYFVARGMLRAVATGPGEKVGATLGYLGPGDVIGEMAVLGNGYHTARVLAESAAAVIIISTEALPVLMQSFRSFPRRLLGVMYQRIAANARSL